jgi:hypothetical protein
MSAVGEVQAGLGKLRELHRSTCVWFDDCHPPPKNRVFKQPLAKKFNWRLVISMPVYRHRAVEQ